MEGLLTLILLILRLILVLGLTVRLSVVLMMNVYFATFVGQMLKVVRCQEDPPRLPLSQQKRHQKEYSVHGRRKISNQAAISHLPYEEPRLEVFNDSVVELDHEDELQNVSTGPTYLQEGVDTNLLRDIRKNVLPAKAEEIAKFFRQ